MGMSCKKHGMGLLCLASELLHSIATKMYAVINSDICWKEAAENLVILCVSYLQICHLYDYSFEQFKDTTRALSLLKPDDDRPLCPRQISPDCHDRLGESAFMAFSHVEKRTTGVPNELAGAGIACSRLCMHIVSVVSLVPHAT